MCAIIKAKKEANIKIKYQCLGGNNMGKIKKQKLSQEELEQIETILSYLEVGTELDELENLLGVTLTTTDFHNITAAIQMKKVSHRNSIRTYSNRGDSEIVIEYRERIKNLRVIEKNFQVLKETSITKEKEVPKSLKKGESNEERKEQIVREIELIDYFCTKESQEIFEEYKNSLTLPHNIKLLEKLRSIYMENTLSLFQYKKESFNTIYEIVSENTKLSKHLRKNKEQFYALLNTDEFSPFKEKLVDLSMKYHKSKHILTDLQRLLDIEKKMTKALTPIEMSNEDLIEFGKYIEEPNTTPYYNIIEKLSADDRNFGYIKRLLKEIPGCIDARKALNGKEKDRKDKESVHICVTILDKFIHNYKLKLVNQGFDYTEPQFYKEIIKLYYEENVTLKDKEKIQMLTMLESFEEYAIGKQYQATSNVLEDIAEIKNGLNHCEKKEQLNQSPSRNIKQEIGQMSSYILEEAARRNERLGYEEYAPNDVTKTLMLEDLPNYAFSIQYSSTGETYFGIHILDNRNLVSMDEEAIKLVKAGKKILPTFTPKKKYPTMSFAYRIKGNKVGGLQIAPATIVIDKKYEESELDRYKEISDVKELVRVTSILNDTEIVPENIYEVEGISKLLEKSLSKDIGEKLESQHIPFVYEKSLDEQEELILENHNKTCGDLFNIPKQEAHNIYRLLDEDKDKYYMPHRGIDGRIDLNSDSDLGLYLIDTLYKIKNMQNENGPMYEPEQAKEEVLEKIEELNSKNTYTPAQIKKNNERTIKKMIRTYKKSQKS